MTAWAPARYSSSHTIDRGRATAADVSPIDRTSVRARPSVLVSTADSAACPEVLSANTTSESAATRVAANCRFGMSPPELDGNRPGP